MDLGRLQVVPEDPARPVVLALELDHGAGCRDHVDGQVVVGQRQVLAQDLDRVDGGGDDGVFVDQALLDQQGVLQVRETRRPCPPGRR